jgi:lauroyl/myristoyl acyltransferase
VSALRRLEGIALPAFLRVLRRLPYSASEGILIGLSLGRAVHDHRRLRRTYAWAARGGAGARSRWAVVLGLLVNRGRALAASPFTALLDPERARQRLEVRGLDHLEEARRRGGVILLGFHVGIIIIHRFLALLGYEVTAMGGSGLWHRVPSVPAPWQAVLDRSPTHVWTEAPGSRADALYRLRQAALSGGIVMIMASGGRGRVLFDLPLPGRPLSVRAGWFVLRRATGLPTLPVLGHLEGGRRVVTIHPALPAPDPDEPRDRDACRAALNPILEDFVARFPEQCVYLAMDIDVQPRAAPGVPSPEPS